MIDFFVSLFGVFLVIAPFVITFLIGYGVGWCKGYKEGQKKKIRRLLQMPEIELKPCPFCGNNPYVEKYDYFIIIGCENCSYSKTFHGLVQREINTGIPVVYTGGRISDYEWYDPQAHERAFKAWNKRIPDEALKKEVTINE